MNCPYCAESINRGATVCKTCRRDISLVMSLQEAKHTLEGRITELEEELAVLRKQHPAGLEALAVEEETRSPSLLDLAVIYLLLPTVVLVGIHYLLIIRFDVRLLWLRLASIALPAVFGWMLNRKLKARWFVELGFGVVVAFASVFGMSTMVHFTDGNPILPNSAVDWRETLEYVTSISLSYLLGGLLSRAAQPILLKPAPRRGAKMAKFTAFLAKHVTGKKGQPLEERVQRLVKLAQLGISASTAIGAVYTGLKDVL
jgi:hypothetical protein